MADFQFKMEKTINALLYICQRNNGSINWYSVFKILYFADKNHLIQYGRPISGDDVKLMNSGPVPYWAFAWLSNTTPNKYFTKKERTLTALMEPDLDYLSKSDIRCIDNAFEEVKALGFDFGRIRDKAHDELPVYQNIAPRLNGIMSYEELATQLEAGPEVIEAIHDFIENEKLSLS